MPHHPLPRLRRWLIAPLFALLLLAGQHSPGRPAQDGPKKLPVPTAAAQKKAEALVLDVFKEDIDGATDAPARSKLAAQLLQQGKDLRAPEEAAPRYVLYTYARKLAAQAGDAPLTLQAVEDISREFDVPLLQAKAEVLPTVAANLTGPEPSRALVDVAMTLLTEAVDQDNYPAARIFGDVAEKAAIKSKSFALVASIKKRVQEVAEVEKGYAKMQPFLDRLKKDPKDAEANLELGKYFALLKNKWDRGLPFLGKGGDSDLRAQAQQDLGKPQEGAAQLAVADGWWALAAKEKEPVASNMKLRAGFWYDQAIGNLTGLNRTKAEKRLLQIAGIGKTEVVVAPPSKAGLLKEFPGHTREVKCVAIAPNGKYGLSGSVDNTMRLWDLNTGKELRSFQGHTKEVWGCAFTPTGQPLSASWDGTVKLWDVETGKELKTFVHPKDVNGVAVSRDGKWLLTGCDDYAVRLWDLKSGQEVRRYNGHSGYAYGVAFSPDMKYVASGSADRTVLIHDFATGNKVREITGPANYTNSVAFSTDSRHVFACGDSVPRVWEIETGKEIRRFEGSSPDVANALALTPDGRRVLTGHGDNSVRLWDAATGKELQRFAGHTGSVLAVAFSGDGRRALSGGTDGTVRLWGLPAR